MTLRPRIVCSVLRKKKKDFKFHTMQKFTYRLLLIGFLTGFIVLSLVLHLNSERLKQQAREQRALDSQGSEDRFISRKCPTLSPSDINVECFYYFTHKRKAKLPEEGFRLPVALLKAPSKPEVDVDSGIHADSANSTRNLVVKIPGGPGAGFQTIASEIDYWQRWMHDFKVDFDILLFDPRATGESLPSPQCAEYDELSNTLFSQAASVKDESVQLSPILEKCLYQFAEQIGGGDAASAIAQMSSRYQADDIKQIIEYLPYDNVALWGVSYGTRVALLAADSPKVNLLLLDSPYPLGFGGLKDWPALTNNSFALHEAIYSLQPFDEFESFASLYQSASEKLRQKPRKYQILHWTKRHIVDFVLTEQRLVDVSFSSLYYIPDAKAFYFSLREIANESILSNFTLSTLDGFVNNVLDEQFNYLVFFAVDCLDSVPIAQTDFEAELDKYPQVREYFSTFWDYNVCHSPLFEQAQPLTEEAYADVPTYLLVGEYDPVTPITWADYLYEQLSTVNLKYHAAGHAVLDIDACGHSLTNMLADASVWQEMPDIHCEVEE